MSESLIVPVHAGDNRLVSLGMHYLVDGGEAPASHQTLIERFDQAETVLVQQAWVEHARNALAEDQTVNLHDKGNTSGRSVQVRLTSEQIELALQALHAFLDRPDPKTDPFREGVLIDPPQTVQKVIDRFVIANTILARERHTAGLAQQLIN
jgi:hypothetical protein